MLYADPSLPLAAVCLLLSAGVWYLLFVTPLLPHLVGRLSGEELDSHDDLCAWLAVRNLPKLSWLTLCLPCQTCWTAAATVLLFNIGAEASLSGWLVFPLVWLLSLPPVSILLKTMLPH